MSPDLAAMVQPFADEELHTFQGVGGKQLTYIEDETVMDRLDIGFGRGNWSIHVDADPAYEGVVKVTLSVRVDDGPWVEYQDYGYPNNKDGQALKEAVSDGIRRCGRYLGIARDLYRKDSGPNQPRPVALPRPDVLHDPKRPTAGPIDAFMRAPARSSTVVPEPPLDWDVLDNKKPQPFAQAQAAKIETDGSWTYPQLADKAKALSVPLKVLGDTSKRLFGPDAWKLTDLTGEQRYAVAVEVGLL
jgi:hypothetical protein